MPDSLARLHYPFLVYRNGNRKLWDPVRRKVLEIRPEERVRQRLINCFIEESLYPRSRISTERKADPDARSQIDRTDILCYNQEFQPDLLVECKAEKVPIKEDAATQIARYNRSIGAPLLLLSNGVQDYWYQIRDDELLSLDRPPYSIQVASSSQRSIRYWTSRGFLGDNTPTAISESLTALLNRFWIGNKADPAGTTIQFLSFQQHLNNVNLNHYYWIVTLDENPRTRVATAFTNSIQGQTHLLCVVNRENENIGFIDINFKLLQSESSDSMVVYTAGQRDSLNAGDLLPESITDLTSADTFEALTQRLARIVKQKINR